ncbi:MAG: YIP1 family protein [Candidatus Eremiobacteraeota bacterium]|nr:YIP1 family protein [Candidatus Eremiobacteraeota bacterium]
MSADIRAAGKKPNGLSTVIDVIAAPKTAFETLREAPMWGWAFVITAILSIIGTYLALPVTLHVFEIMFRHQMATSPNASQLTPEQIQKSMRFSEALVRNGFLFAPVGVLIGVLVQTVIMLIFKAIGRGTAGFKQLWCSAMNAAVVVGLYYVVYGVILMLRGPDSFSSTTESLLAMPSLGWLMPHGPVKLVTFLATFNPFYIWSSVLIGVAMSVVARVSRPIAILTAVLSIVVPAIFAAGFAR